ncbi:hypothetical protein THASP1DRAFT_24480 [Thamnocephalis sphaerospora]|uniref:Uncharacterized protein n=1 Tax=Thamnocephalis sphaerospora TaxID=78915 RepID=A0A4P9XN73_9FUNG|nr:hypothetical protein THASP1DRAFT_24480 [Thamnocephalis sphaerospora]|eukprot:RKP07366.1 hypothetical protein THASP1DRAFT_24480 [Thamnocephalis sphaerospora]
MHQRTLLAGTYRRTFSATARIAAGRGVPLDSIVSARPRIPARSAPVASSTEESVPVHQPAAPTQAPAAGSRATANLLFKLRAITKSNKERAEVKAAARAKAGQFDDAVEAAETQQVKAKKPASPEMSQASSQLKEKVQQQHPEKQEKQQAQKQEKQPLQKRASRASRSVAPEVQVVDLESSFAPPPLRDMLVTARRANKDAGASAEQARQQVREALAGDYTRYAPSAMPQLPSAAATALFANASYSPEQRQALAQTLRVSKHFTKQPAIQRMDALRNALGATDAYRLPDYLADALNNRAVESPPASWNAQANISGALELLLLQREIPLDAIATLANDALDEDVLMDADSQGDVAAGNGRDDNEIVMADTEAAAELALCRHQFARSNPTASSLCSSSHQAKLQRVLERVAAKCAAASDEHLDMLCTLAFSHANASRVMLASQVDLLSGLLLPKLRNPSTEATRELQQLLQNVAGREPYAYAHGILARWVREKALQPWQADMLRRTFQETPALYRHLDAVLRGWAEDDDDDDDDMRERNSYGSVVWDDTLFALITHWIDSGCNVTIEGRTLHALVCVLARLPADVARSPKLGLLAIALVRRLSTLAKAASSNAGQCGDTATISDAATILLQIAEQLRPVQARTLRQHLKRSKLLAE